VGRAQDSRFAFTCADGPITIFNIRKVVWQHWWIAATELQLFSPNKQSENYFLRHETLG
jgi:hypothetical protein